MTPARNRVSPRGNIIATTGRGAWMGNRGRLHEGTGARDIVRNHRTKSWITCLLDFRNRYTPQWDPTHYTQLFFLDEAVALAAGHRPCAECRSADYQAYRRAWRQNRSGAMPYAKEMDAVLHRERLNADRQLAPWTDLPDGVFVETDDGPAVVIRDHLGVFDADTYSYCHRIHRPATGSATVITPASTVGALRAGYLPQIDAAAR